MPAAELFGSWVIAHALRREGADFHSVICVTDCEPAAAVINAGVSGNRQMRDVMKGALNVTDQWLAVQVPREWNTDADRLSHPALVEDVAADARACGLAPA